MKLRLYGIPNCDRVKKARRHLDTHGMAYEFVDFNLEPPDCETIDRWLRACPIDRLFNTRSTTWRQLKATHPNPDDTTKRTLLCQHDRLIKRPVLETDDGRVVAGYDETIYKEILP
jgi:Spx/MgsR family transcriptional regulator